MKTRAKLILGNLVIAIISVSISGFLIFEIQKTSKTINELVPNAIKDLSDKSYLDNLSQFIKYYDEVLTQSARNYAFTGDKKWKERYYSVVPDLDSKINEAIVKGDQLEKSFFDKVDKSNKALILLEEKSFSLVDSGKLKEAVQVLESQEYAEQKVIYSEGLADYLKTRGGQYKEALSSSTVVAEDTGRSISGLISRLVTIFLIGNLFFIIFSIIFIWYFSKIIATPVNYLKAAIENIVKGDFNNKIVIKSKDEFEEIAESFNKMNEKLKESNENIEYKIRERTKELEALNKFMVGRELKMVELKKKINELEKK